ncbi:MAG: Ppx/GppA family phosphatase [Gemmatimonadaceae bacterium]|nr:Ppx/GppA family phosphatase [Gemmatimonadaceae bacterium]
MTSPLRLEPATAGRGEPRPDAERIAAIDIGSNSIRQIVADVSPNGAIRVVDEMKAAPRLGSGLSETGRLGEANVEAAIEALSRMATLAKQLDAKRIEAVATSAVRDAANGRLFLQRVRREAGLKVRTLVGEEEARLAFRSALAHFELGRGRAVVMDIGGGSLELAMSAEGLVERLISLPYGAIRLTERFLIGRPPVKGVRKLRKHVRDTIRDALPVRDWRGAELIGSGGTFTNLAGIHLARTGMQGARSVHGTALTLAEVEHILEWLVALTPAERLAVPGLNHGRADIIIAGLAVAAEVMGRVEPVALQVSRYGIREGLLLESARVMPQIADPGEARERSVREFAERCHYEAPHAAQVQRLSLQLFDALGSRLGLEPDDRPVLADAALLHDVGYHINYKQHHKHSFHLIQHAELLGMSPADQMVVAHVARYHRGSNPDRRRHEAFGALDRATRERITILSAILRVADGLDRGHVAAVDRVKVRWMPRAIRITPVPVKESVPLRLELWGAARKAGLLAEVAGVPVEIVGADGRAVSPDSATQDGD